MKKTLNILIIVALMMGIWAFPAFADDGCTTYPYITMENSDDFTVVKLTHNEEAITVQGLDSSWVKHDFTTTEKQYITWTTSDTAVVKFKSGPTTVSSVSGTDTATLKMMGQGRATVTITYDTPDDDPVTVTSYVVVEKNNTTPSVSGIDVEVDASGTANDVTKTNLTVKLFDLNDVFGENFDDDDVLKKDASALHALLFALELQHDADGCTDIDDANWDWDWVSSNVTIGNEGAYVSVIGDDENDPTYGWQYKVNSNTQAYAASIYELSEDDSVLWEYTTWPW